MYPHVTIDVATCDRAVLAMAGSMMASGRSSPLFVRSAVYPQHFADQRVAPIVPMHAPKPMAPGVDRMLACAEERVVALRRAQQVRSEQKDLGETSRVTWRPPPTRDTRLHVLTPKPTPSTPSCKPSPHVTPKLILASQSAQELLDLSFRKTPKLSRPWSAGDAPPYAPQRQTATTTFDSAIEIYAPKTKPSSGFDAQLRSRVAPVWELLRSTTAALQAQVDEAARVRAQLEAELAERTAKTSQLEQACARLTAERLEERMVHEADKGALEVALEHERARLSLSPMLESLRSQADEAQAEAAALKAQAEAHSEAQAEALKAQVDEGARLRAQLEAELVERTANASQLEQACARLTAERLEERMAHEADKGALEAALERDRSRLRAALKASVALGLVAIHEHRGGVQGSSQVPHIDTALGLVASHEHRHERMSRTSGADTADFEAVTSKQSMMAQDELRRARQQFASEVAKLRMEVTKLRVGIKSVLTLGLSIKDESDQARFFAAKQPTAKLTNVRLVEVTKPTNVRLVEVTKLAKSRVGVSLVMHGRSVIVHHVASTSPFEGKVFPGDVISLASDGIISPKVLDANGLSQYIFAASSLSLCVETPAVLASARSPSISDRSPSLSASDLSCPSPSTQQIARGQHIEPTVGLADDPRLLPPRALSAGAPRTVENMVQVLQDAAARAESEVRAKHAELVADYRARTRTAEPLRHTASTSSTTGFSSSSLYRIPRG